MSSRLLLWAGLLVLLVACGGGADDATVEEGFQEPTEGPEPSAADEDQVSVTTPTPGEADPIRVPVLSATVADLLDRTDLTATVSDLVDRPTAEVPDLVGLTESLARDEAEAAGFVPYFVDTFPPTGGMPRVFETFPRADIDHELGASLFIEVDGPVDGVVISNGERLSGVLNGQQFSMNANATVWTVPMWLDEPLAYVGAEGEVAVGREVAVAVQAGDVSCEVGGQVADAELMKSGLRASFVFDHKVDVELFAPIGGRDLEIECSAGS